LNTNKAILNSVLPSDQNPLLSIEKFYDYCRKRFFNIGHSISDFRYLLELYIKYNYFTPALLKDERAYYSTFQVYMLNLLEQYRKRSLSPHAGSHLGEKVIKAPIKNWYKTLMDDSDMVEPQLEDFNSLLKLLMEIQDFYLPEVRTNQRVGLLREYHGGFIKVDKLVLTSALKNWREMEIANRNYVPQEYLEESDLTIEDLKIWVSKIAMAIHNIDPLSDWNLLIRYIDYEKRMKLKGAALLAVDFYEIAGILMLFLKDLSIDFGERNIYDILDRFDLSARDESSKLPVWKKSSYGHGYSKNPYQMLEFLTNEYGINSRQRAIIFTEGEEWKSIVELYGLYKIDPNILGIEFRSIGGSGNFSLSNWQCFIEYMHEKQVLIYFLLDKEGIVSKEARRLINAKRKFNFAGLEYVIPEKDRIIIWSKGVKPSSYEESNFTDNEISMALKNQNVSIPAGTIKAIRSDPKRKKGLIKSISVRCGILNLNKSKLDIDLVSILIKRRKKTPNVKYKRPIDKFILKSSKLILQTHPAKNNYDLKFLNESNIWG